MVAEKEKALPRGAAKAGDGGIARAGSSGRAASGLNGASIVGNHGYAVTGARGKAIAGEGGIAKAGDGGMAIAGYEGTAQAGVGGIAQAGEKGKLRIRWRDEQTCRLHTVTGVVSKGEIHPGTPYKLSNNHTFTEAYSEAQSFEKDENDGGAVATQPDNHRPRFS